MAYLQDLPLLGQNGKDTRHAAPRNVGAEGSTRKFRGPRPKKFPLSKKRPVINKKGVSDRCGSWRNAGQSTKRPMHFAGWDVVLLGKVARPVCVFHAGPDGEDNQTQRTVNSQPWKTVMGRHFKAAVLIGIRESNEGLAISFFINERKVQSVDLGVMLGGLKMVEDEFRDAFRQALRAKARKKGQTS